MLISDYDSQTILTYLSQADLNSYLTDWYQIVQLCNKLVDTTKPRSTLKAGDPSGTEAMQTLLYLIYRANILIAPYLLDAHSKVAANL